MGTKRTRRRSESQSNSEHRSAFQLRLMEEGYRKSGTNQPRTLRLEPIEFIRRFLQHVLPSGFRKIRHFGLHHSSKRGILRTLQAAMAIQAGRALPAAEPTAPPPPACPHCAAPMHFEGRILPNGITQRYPHLVAPRAPP